MRLSGHVTRGGNASGRTNDKRVIYPLLADNGGGDDVTKVCRPAEIVLTTRLNFTHGGIGYKYVHQG